MIWLRTTQVIIILLLLTLTAIPVLAQRTGNLFGRSGLLEENSKAIYIIDGKEYEVEVLSISETARAAKLRVNGQITDALESGDAFLLADGAYFVVNDLLISTSSIVSSKVAFMIGNVPQPTIPQPISFDVKEVRQFELENGYYSFGLNFIFNDFFIDGFPVSVQQGVIGGAAQTWYKIKCREGKLLEARFKNPVSGQLTTWKKDISAYTCEPTKVQEPTLPTPIAPVQLPVESVPQEKCKGCEINNRCLQFGIRLVADSGIPSYCDWDKMLKAQKQNKKPCQNNYECLSNNCGNGMCLDIEQRIQSIEKELQEQKGILQRIMDFFSKLFGK